MCVIICKPNHVKISGKVLKKCFARNKDGAGILVNREYAKKGFFKFGDLWDEVQKYQNEDLVIHCRKASVGPISQKYCHPFVVNNSFLFHNGTIKGLGNEKVSDTYKVASILEQKETDWERILEYLSHKTKSRFCLVSKTEMVKFGKWYKLNGLSFSNLNWKKKSILGFFKSLPENRPDHLCWNCDDKIMPWKWFCSNCGVLLKEPI